MACDAKSMSKQKAVLRLHIIIMLLWYQAWFVVYTPQWIGKGRQGSEVRL